MKLSKNVLPTEVLAGCLKFARENKLETAWKYITVDMYGVKLWTSKPNKLEDGRFSMEDRSFTSICLFTSIKGKPEIWRVKIVVETKFYYGDV